MPTDKCEHNWEVMLEYSRFNSITRYRCLVCGCWGYRTISRTNPNKPIRAYKGPLMNPDPHWKHKEYTARESDECPAREARYLDATSPTSMERAVYESYGFVDPGEYRD